MKKIIAALLALTLVMGLATSALASAGDATIYYVVPENGVGYYSIDSCMLAGNRVVYYTGRNLYIYDIETKQTEEYDASALAAMGNDNETEFEEEAEEDGSVSEENREIVTWFAYGDELYAIVNVNANGEDSRSIDGGYIYRLDLADGAANLAESEMPQLDWSNMIEDYGDYAYSRWPQCAFASGDRLFVQSYDDDGNSVVEVFDLTTGRCSEHYIQDMFQMAPAGDGKILERSSFFSTTGARARLISPSMIPTANRSMSGRIMRSIP